MLICYVYTYGRKADKRKKNFDEKKRKPQVLPYGFLLNRLLFSKEVRYTNSFAFTFGYTEINQPIIVLFKQLIV